MVEFLSYLFSIASFGFAVSVVVSRNPVHAVLSLISAFVFTTALRRLRAVEYRSLIFIVVYVGAVAVLFIFVVRRLNVQPTSAVTAVPVLGIVSVGLGLLLVSLNYGPVVVSDASLTEWVGIVDRITSAQQLGQVLYTHYFIYFLVAGFVLLVARLGAVVLSLSVPVGSTIGAQRQQVHEQISRNADRAVLKVDVKE